MFMFVELVCFESLLEEKEEELVDIDEDVVVFYVDMGYILLVKVGDLLMCCIFLVLGQDGIDICGGKVLVWLIVDVFFVKECIGVELSEEDFNLLVVIVLGQFMVIKNGVKVNLVLDVENVDFFIGNLSFEGMVCVLGDVFIGMKMNVGGDVVINGIVEVVEIVVGGSVMVKGGVIGYSEGVIV